MRPETFADSVFTAHILYPAAGQDQQFYWTDCLAVRMAARDAMPKLMIDITGREWYP